MKKILKKILPPTLISMVRGVFRYILIWECFLSDRYLYNKYQKQKYNFTDRNIFVQAHSLEKGLSLNKPREAFGEKKAIKLANLVHSNIEKASESALDKAIGVLQSYLKFRESSQGALDKELYELKEIYAGLAKKHKPKNLKGGVIEHDKPLGSEDIKNTFPEFLRTRKSVRHFAPNFDEKDLLRVRKAAELAALAPSQCNRQSSKIHIYSNEEQIQKLLSIQGGTRGFTEEIPCIAVVTNQINYWRGPAQRNQIWIDGGLFGMTFLLALHSQNFATCTLNMAKTYKEEKRFKGIADIEESERVLFLIAIGNFPESYRTAISNRIPLEKYCNFHG